LRKDVFQVKDIDAVTKLEKMNNNFKRIFLLLIALLVVIIAFIVCIDRSWEDILETDYQYGKFGDILKVPTLVSPSDATNTNRKPTFTWSSSNETKDTFQLAKDPNFAELVVAVSDITAKSYIHADYLASQQNYYFRVKSDRLVLSTEWSSTNVFYVAMETPTLLTPEDEYGFSNTETRPTFAWEALEGDVTYSLQIGTDSTFAINKVDRTLTSNTYTLSSSEAFGDGEFGYWRVRASDIGGDGAWSETRNFSN
jgi:hypothetical protein